MTALTDAERETLRILFGCVIPASEVDDLPGADDEAIFTDIMAGAGAHVGRLREIAGTLDRMAGGPLTACPGSVRQRTVGRFRAEAPASAALIATLVAQCYYRDDRVMRALGMERRPPFPKGFVLEEGDWSLLDPIRSRAPIWRRT